ncbi:MAG: hypothetical protein AAF940_07440 [Pseudomonadota bacterium]
MTKTTLLAATVLAFSASTAFAGYTIYQDDAFPSVMFVEIEGGPVEEPTVISAPANVSVNPIQSLSGGEEDNAPSAVNRVDDDDEASGSATAGTQAAQSSEPTFEERVERNVQLGDNTESAVQRVIREDQLDDMELR